LFAGKKHVLFVCYVGKKQPKHVGIMPEIQK